MMKKRKFITCLFVSLLFLSSCSLSLRSGESIARELYSSIIDYSLENKKDDLINLFAKNIYSEINDFDSKIDEMLDYITGTFVSSEYELGTGVRTERNNFKRIVFLYNAACELYTTDFKYFISFLYCSVDDYNSDNIGIWNLMVQKCNGEGDYFIPYDSYDEWLNGDTYRGITLI